MFFLVGSIPIFFLARELFLTGFSSNLCSITSIGTFNFCSNFTCQGLTTINLSGRNLFSPVCIEESWNVSIILYSLSFLKISNSILSDKKCSQGSSKCITSGLIDLIISIITFFLIPHVTIRSSPIKDSILFLIVL